MIIKVNGAIVYHCAVQFCNMFPLSRKASVCFMGWMAIPVTRAFNFVCLHTRCVIAIIVYKEIMAAIKRKMSIIILLKNEHLLSSLLDLSHMCPFCLYCLTRSFRISGAFNKLVSNSDVCNDIGKTCSFVVQF